MCLNTTCHPEVLFYLPWVYKRNVRIKKAVNLKGELLKCTFELVPLMGRKIHNI